MKCSTCGKNHRGHCWHLQKSARLPRSARPREPLASTRDLRGALKRLRPQRVHVPSPAAGASADDPHAEPAVLTFPGGDLTAEPVPHVVEVLALLPDYEPPSRLHAGLFSMSREISEAHLAVVRTIGGPGGRNGYHPSPDKACSACGCGGHASSQCPTLLPPPPPCDHFTDADYDALNAQIASWILRMAPGTRQQREALARQRSRSSEHSPPQRVPSSGGRRDKAILGFADWCCRHHYTPVFVPPDGTCLFHAVGVHVQSRLPRERRLDLRLRSIVAQEMRSHMKDYLPWANDSDGNPYDPAAFIGVFCRGIETTFWGDELCIRAVARAFGIAFRVLHENGELYRIPGIHQPARRCITCPSTPSWVTQTSRTTAPSSPLTAERS